MKLVDILARELKEWQHEYDHVAQEYDGQMWYGTADIYCSGNVWLSEDGEYGATLPVAEDWKTAIVTRAAWQAAKDKLEGNTVKKPKASKDGFIRHRGGKCPVEAGTLVDVRFRNGEIARGQPALQAGDPSCGWAQDWSHTGRPGDIMAWKLHTPSEQPAAVKESLSVEPAVRKGVSGGVIGSSINGPLQWRDRITEIDAESKAEAERHNAVIAALDSERAELVQKLANEGLALIERKAQPVEDMSDPANWKAGDLLECIDCPDPKYTEGKLYSFLCLSDWGSARTIDNSGNENGIMPIQFKWHSRPTN